MTKKDVTCQTMLKPLGGVEDGFFNYFLVLRFPIDRVATKEGGFFTQKEQHWETKPVEVYMEANLLTGEVFTGVLETKITEQGISFWDDIGKAYSSMGWRDRFSVYEVNNLETVNTHQWEGVAPVILTLGGHQPERGCWDIAGVNETTGKRVLLARTHASRDDVFQMMTRLNMLFAHIRETLKPWQSDMEKLIGAKCRVINDDLPKDQQENARKGLAERIEAFGTPKWDWE